MTLGTGFLLCSLLTSCSEEDSGLPSVSSLHYVQVTIGTSDGESFDSREEGYYRAPDSAHFIGGDGSPLGLEQVVIGSRVWERRTSGWSVRTEDADCYNALDKIKEILAYGGEHEGVMDAEDGRVVAGEVTWRYTWETEDAGRYTLLAAERTLGDAPAEAGALARIKETFSNLKGTGELIIGKNTGRVYSLKQTLEGPRLTRETEWVVDQYDQPVAIEPPPNVPAEGKTQGIVDCRDYETRFPWIPAAAAAVLGPLLFLGASAFVWPRRL